MLTEQFEGDGHQIATMAAREIHCLHVTDYSLEALPVGLTAPLLE
jgi:hypothetical protein